MAAKPKPKKIAVKKPKTETDYEYTWIPKIYAIPKVKAKKKPTPLPEISTRLSNPSKTKRI